MQTKNKIKQLSVALLTLVIAGTGCSSLNKGKAAKNPIAGNPWSIKLPGDALLPMSWISPGTFVMGSPESEKGHKADESPQTTVTLAKGYWLGNTLLTIGQWKAVTGLGIRDKVNKMLNDETLYDFENGKKQKIRDYMNFDRNNPDKIMANENEALPMYFVSWNEAMDFCNKLNMQERAAGRLPAGYEYTLPTEAQWEYACRAGTIGATYVLPVNANSTDGNLDGIAWYGKNSLLGYAGRGLGPTAAGPRDVGTKRPNQLGLYDMLGNIWEWCRDWYGPYAGGNIVDPAGPQTGTYRVNRGGSWGSGIYDERSANRAKNPPNEDSAYRGFRISLSAVK